MPLFSLVFGGLLNSFFDPAGIVAEIERYSGYLALLALGAFLSAFVGLGSVMWSAERQGLRIRRAYFAALMRAEVGYHDTAHTAEAVTRMSEDVGAMLKGIGEPLANSINSGTQFVAGIIMGFTRGPKLAAVVCAFLPLLAACAAGMKVLLSKVQKQETDAYARAGEVATETIANIKTVASYCGEEAEVARYAAHLGKAEAMGVRRGLVTGGTMGALWFSMLTR